MRCCHVTICSVPQGASSSRRRRRSRGRGRGSIARSKEGVGCRWTRCRARQKGTTRQIGRGRVRCGRWGCRATQTAPRQACGVGGGGGRGPATVSGLVQKPCPLISPRTSWNDTRSSWTSIVEEQRVLPRRDGRWKTTLCCACRHCKDCIMRNCKADVDTTGCLLAARGTPGFGGTHSMPIIVPSVQHDPNTRQGAPCCEYTILLTMPHLTAWHVHPPTAPKCAHCWRPHCCPVA